jgi:hypothetical protein
MRATLLALAVTALAMPALAADDGNLSNLKDFNQFTHSAWLCSSPEAYDAALAAEKALNGAPIDKLKGDLLDKKMCMHVGSGQIEGIMAPWVKVLENDGDKVKVSFTINDEERIELLHRKISRVTYAGWTGKLDIESYADWRLLHR